MQLDVGFSSTALADASPRLCRVKPEQRAGGDDDPLESLVVSARERIGRR